MTRWINALAIFGLLLLPSICIAQAQEPTNEELSRMTLAERCRALAPRLSRMLNDPPGTSEANQFMMEIWRNSCVERPATQAPPQPSIRFDLTANDYLSGCEGLVHASEHAQYMTDLFGTGMCFGLLKGLGLAVAVAEKNRFLCQPASVSTVQAARVLVAYLEAHQARLHEDVTVLAMEAFKAAWPCRLDQPSNPTVK